VGLWSVVMRTAWPFLDKTARESPTFATQRWGPRLYVKTAVVPVSLQVLSFLRDSLHLKKASLRSLSTERFSEPFFAENGTEDLVKMFGTEFRGIDTAVSVKNCKVIFVIVSEN